MFSNNFFFFFFLEKVWRGSRDEVKHLFFVQLYIQFILNMIIVMIAKIFLKHIRDFPDKKNP